MSPDDLAELIRTFSNDALHHLYDARDFIEANEPESRDEALSEIESKLEMVRDYAARLLGDCSFMPDNITI